MVSLNRFILVYAVKGRDRMVEADVDIQIGSAPDIAGKGVVNPVAMILSTAMMLQYSFNLPDEARAIEEAVKNTIESGVRTKDIGGTAGTKEVGDRVAEELEKIIKR